MEILKMFSLGVTLLAMAFATWFGWRGEYAKGGFILGWAIMCAVSASAL